MQKEEKRPILVYHKGCLDGFGARFAFELKYGDSWEYFPLDHSSEMPEYEGRDVVFADIAPPTLEIGDDIYKKAKSFLILDHHKSANDKFQGRPYFSFDIDKSGCMLAAEYVFGSQEVPELFYYIQDRDLWLFNLEDTKYIINSLASREQTFQSWFNFKKQLESSFDLVISEGEAIERYIKKTIELNKENFFIMNIKGFEVPTINSSFCISESLDSFLDENLETKVVAAYTYRKGSYKFSLRSNNRFDCTIIANQFEIGGGHRGAAGFTISSLDELNK